MHDLDRGFPNSIETEKKLLSAIMLKGGSVIPDVCSIVEADDFYRPEHKIIFRAITSIFFQGVEPDPLSIEQFLRKSGELDKVDRKYLFSLIDMEFTTARAHYQATVVKEKSDLRKLIDASRVIIDHAEQQMIPPSQIIAEAFQTLDQINRSAAPSKKSSFGDFFMNHLADDIALMQHYANRTTGFDNIDKLQFFSPGLYVIGATPAAGKTTFCWQLLEQLALRGESCIYCSYEMSRLELFAKSLARELFNRVPDTKVTAADIRHGSESFPLLTVRDEFAQSKIDLSVFELQDESINELLALLRPLCKDKAKAPVVCLDYLQIVPFSHESTKLGIDDSVRKLKKFQRDTNTTFIVISSFNRNNYTHSVSFESFKESGNIEYTADVVWALQLNVLNDLNPCNITDARKQIEDAKKQQPRQIQLKCLKNRHGTNYDCFFLYHSAHDCFVPCKRDDFRKHKHNSKDDDID